MANRHQRRKAAERKLTEKMQRIRVANEAYEREKIVKANKRSPIERNYYPQSCMANLKGQSHRAYVGRNTKGTDYLPRGSVAHGFNRG